MKKSWMWAVMLLAALAATGAEPVQNGAFATAGADGKPEGWKIEMASAHRDNIAVVPTPAVSEPGALRLRSNNFVYQDVKLEPKTDYVFSCFYKAEKVDPDPSRDLKKYPGGMEIAIFQVLPDGKTKWMRGTGKKFYGTTEWSKFEYKFNSASFPSGVFRVRLSSQGCVYDSAAYFDDAVLETVNRDQTRVHFPPVEYQQMQYYVAENMPGMPRIEFTGDAKALAAAGGVKLILELPKNFTLLGTTGMRPGADATAADYYAASGAVELPAVKMAGNRRFEAVVPERLVGLLKKDDFNWSNRLYFFLEAARGSAGQGGRAYLELNAGGKTLYSTVFNLMALPPVKLPERPARMLVGGVCRPFSQAAGNAAVNSSYLNFWSSLTEKREAGAADIAFYQRWRPDFYRAFDFFAETGVAEGNVPVLAALDLRNTPEWRAMARWVDRDGRASAHGVAPWYTAEQPDHAVFNRDGEIFARRFAAYRDKVVAVLDNYETNVDGGYDPGNLERFAKFAKLAKTPTREEVRKNHTEKWRQFRVRQNADYSRNYAAMFHKNFPGLQYRPCNTPLYWFKLPVDTDQSLYDDVTDVHQHMFYWCGSYFFDLVKYNIAQLGKPQYILVDPTEHFQMFYRRYTPEEVGRNIIVAAALGAHGFSFYPDDAFDGRYFQPIADGFDAVAKLETFYECRNSAFPFTATPANVITAAFVDNGLTTKITMPDMTEFVRMTSHRAADGTCLVSIFNYSATQNAMFQLQLPGATAGMRLDDPVNRRDYPDADVVKGALVSVPARACGFFRLRPAAAAEPGFAAVRQRELATLLDGELNVLKASSRLRDTRQGDAEISYARLSDTGNKPLLKLQAATHKLYIDFANGADAIGWMRNNDTGSDLFSAGKTRGFAGRLSFYDPTQDREPPYAFALAGTGYEADGAPYAEFEYEVPQYNNVETALNPLMGLHCRKRLILRDGGRKLAMKFDFTNRNPLGKTIPLGFRIVNAPMPGARLLGEDGGINAITWMRTAAPNGGEVRLDSTTPVDFVLLRPGKTVPAFGAYPRAAWQWSPLDIEAVSGKLKEALRFTAGEAGLAGIFSWRSPRMYTVEPLFEVVALPPGATRSFECALEVL